MGIISFAGKIIDYNRGFESIMGPRFHASRERAYARRMRRLDVAEEKIKQSIKEAEKLGSITKAKKSFKKLLKLEHREGKFIFSIIDKEDIVDYDLIKDLEECEKTIILIKDEKSKELVKRIQVMLKVMQDLEELEMGKLAYLQKGGRPWEGVANIISWDPGTTENVVLGEAVKQRRMIGSVKNAIARIKKYAAQIQDEMRAKVPRVDKIKNLQNKQQAEMKDLESSFTNLTSSMRLQFLCTLRLIDFYEVELKEETGMIHHFKEEGYPEDEADKMGEEYGNEIKTVKKQEEVQEGKKMLLASKAARGL